MQDATAFFLFCHPGITDPKENGRGVAIGDFNHNGHLDVIYGNSTGHHRMFLQNQNGMFKVKTVIFILLNFILILLYLQVLVTNSEIFNKKIQTFVSPNEIILL